MCSWLKSYTSMISLSEFVPFLRHHCHTPSESAKTYDSPAVRSIFALLLEEVTRPKQAYSERENHPRNNTVLQHHTAGKPNISDSCFCVTFTRTAIFLSRKEAYKSFFFGIFYAPCTKTRTANTAYRQSDNPYCYHHLYPQRIGFFRLDISGILSIVLNVHFAV